MEGQDDTTAAEDVEAVVGYLKTKATGATRDDAKAALGSADVDHRDGQHSINENILIEIGAAFVLYDKKVVLVWDKRLKIPSNLPSLYRCEFEGNELSWATGMKLMKAVSKFKAGA